MICFRRVAARRAGVWASVTSACIAAICQAGEPPKPLPREITNSIGMKLVLIPAGEFMMGSRESPEALVAAFANIQGNPRRAAQASQFASTLRDERPYHRVRITRPFYLGAHEVTQEQYERVTGKNPSHFSGNPSSAVEMVTWDDAVEPG